jgi:hypothetical protein
VIEEPEIPPLETTSGSTPPPISLALYAQAPANTVATAGEATIKEVPSVEPESAGEEHPNVAMAQRVGLRGEVLANDERGGPRLVVDVEALDSSGAIRQFEGALSLMLLVADDGEEPNSLARWDFSAEEVREAVDPAALPAMRFYLELPAETNVVEPTELWVRLVTPNREKLLTHAEIDLTQPGQFASSSTRPSQPVRDDAIRLAASATPQRTSPEPRPAVLDDGWTIARPGEPASGEASNDEPSQWRTSSEPIPVMAQDTSRARREPDSTRQATDAPRLAPRESPYKRPTWTSERPSASNAVGAKDGSKNASQRQRPLWSATR